MKPRVMKGNGSGIGMRAVWLTAILMSLNVSSAYSEMYIGGQVGTTFFGDNNKLTRVEITDLSAPLDLFSLHGVQCQGAIWPVLLCGVGR